jgi:hypothetical protein
MQAAKHCASLSMCSVSKQAIACCAHPVPAAEGVICRAAALIDVIIFCIFHPILVIICCPIPPPSCTLLLPCTPALPPTAITHQMRLPVVLVVVMQRRQSMLGLITWAWCCCCCPAVQLQLLLVRLV